MNLKAFEDLRASVLQYVQSNSSYEDLEDVYIRFEIQMKII